MAVSNPRRLEYVKLMNELEEKKTALHYMKQSGQLDSLEEKELLTEIKDLDKKLKAMIRREKQKEL